MSESLDDFKASFQRLAELRERRDIDKQAANRSEAAYREKEAELYSELEEAGIQGRHTFDFGGDLGVISFQRRATTYGQVVDKAAAVAALEAEGLSDIIYERSVRTGRLNELVRDRVESRQELPEGVGVRINAGISISRK